jgi:hypothetical protein
VKHYCYNATINDNCTKEGLEYTLCTKKIRKTCKHFQPIKKDTPSKNPSFKVICFPCGKEMKYIRHINENVEGYMCEECLQTVQVSLLK